MGDEIASLVLEVGSYWTKAGYAGEDFPKAVFNTQIGVGQAGMELDTAEQGRKDLHFAESANLFREHMEIRHPLDNGLVADWDLYESLLDFTLRNQLRVSASEQPLMICEPSHNTTEQRIKMAEILFEKLDTPACYFARNGVLSGFTAGKSTALVVDCGASLTSVTPVYDGYVLKKGALHEPLAGNFLSQEVIHILEAQKNISVIPTFKIQRKKLVEAGKPAEVTFKKLSNVTETFETAAKMRVADEFKEAVCTVSEVPYNEQSLAYRPQKPYEFPSGYNGNFGAERFRIPELLFNPRLASLPVAESVVGIPALIQNVLNQCDIDLRPHLLGNIVLTGGSTSFGNMAERLNAELIRYFPGSKIRIHTAGSSMERRFCSWTGGSILASLGTFQQLWISKQEYEEQGGSLLDKRCN